MPSPFRADQLSPQMRERYGVGRRSAAPAVVAVLAVVVLGFVAWLTVAGEATRVDASLLSWDARADHATVTFSVRRAEGLETRCVLRGQDRTRADVGYAVVDLPAGDPQVTVTYELATLMPAYVIELLGCSVDGDPAVNGPQFPPGVAAPEQPWRG